MLLIVAAILVTVVPMAVAFAITRLIKLRVVSSLGLICGAMTSTPALGALTASCDSEAPALSYATVYPAALISVTILSQLLAMLMVRLLGA
jgi:putative transport protein